MDFMSHGLKMDKNVKKVRGPKTVKTWSKTAGTKMEIQLLRMAQEEYKGRTKKDWCYGKKNILEED